ncbi:MAG: UDP-glycosyltransferase [Bacteroidota bacterium]
MKNKKVFILLPDGIGLRNFAFTNFHKTGIAKGFDITFWNATPFNLTELGFKEIKISNPRAHPITDFLKKAQIQIELNLNIKRSKDKVYDWYRFPFSTKNLKEVLKTSIVRYVIFFNNSQKGLDRIRKKIAINERKTKLYFDSLGILEKEKPAIVFCTNQRITTAVASILAAQDLEIPTATFIFSWDNLPKGTKIIETDFYFVWSEHMKNELRYYYPYVKDEQIVITGTPQFEPHFNKTFLQSEEAFFQKHNLDTAKKYICFSGDDVTTSPNDPQYLLDVGNAVRALNAKGNNLGIIFRRCPVDFSNRYDAVLETHNDVIVPVNPEWKNFGESWNTILPTREDLELQINTIFYSGLVINLGSSMVFDFAAFDKPCGFINYDVPNAEYPNWSVKKIYNFIHFRSMPAKNVVFWINSPEEIAEKIERMLTKDSNEIVDTAKHWFEKINQHPPELASERIWTSIETIIKE